MTTNQEQTSLQKHKANLRMAQRMLGIGIWTLDVASRHLEWSDNIYEMFDLPREAFSNSYSAYLELVHAEDRDGVAHPQLPEVVVVDQAAVRRRGRGSGHPHTVVH